MATYYEYMESNEGGMNAAAQDYAEQRISEIDDTIKDLTSEKRFWAHVISLCEDKVCQRCRGERAVTWYPDGTGPGQGARQSVPCPKCRKAEYERETKRINKQYAR